VLTARPAALARVPLEPLHKAVLEPMLRMHTTLIKESLLNPDLASRSPRNASGISVVAYSTPVTIPHYGHSRLTFTVEGMCLYGHNASLYLFLHSSLPCSVSRMQSDGGKASVGSDPVARLGS
jgi:hypothetical protein